MTDVEWIWYVEMPLVAAANVALAVALVRILHRAGRNGFWALMLLLGPFGLFVGIFLFAYTRWPALDRAGDATQP